VVPVIGVSGDGGGWYSTDGADILIKQSDANGEW